MFVNLGEIKITLKIHLELQSWYIFFFFCTYLISLRHIFVNIAIQ